MWCTGGWKRKCSYGVVSELLDRQLTITAYVYHGLEVRHMVKIVRGQGSATIGCPDGFDLSSKARLDILMLRKFP